MTANNPTDLTQVYEQLFAKLKELDPTTTDYAHVIDQLDKLTKMTPKKEPFVKPEVLVAAGANLVGILAILNFERLNPLTSKALGFVTKIRF